MKSLKKYKWPLIALGVTATFSIAGYTIWNRRKTIVPFQQLTVDTKKLAAVLQGVDNSLTLDQLASIEGLAQRYYYVYRHQQHEDRQIRRCKIFKNRQRYFGELLNDVRYEVRCLELIYSQICAAVNVPLEVFKNAQKIELDRQGIDYKIPFNKQLGSYSKKDAHKLSEEEAANLVDDLASEKEDGIGELRLALTNELKSKISGEEEKSLLMKLIDYMAYDAIYLKHSLTQAQVKQLMNFYNLNEKAKDEVAEL
eukprot:TRINITY_DN3925_c0_g1_i9.p1 TRINITY_DN3925_c0_g1~~TRINITY_DN3925_c0_g1_i9.p1  ORF type:complete len:254 (+),score=69.69 TRINITY_DN3925_c0_g1_i9:159-920(+)